MRTLGSLAADDFPQHIVDLYLTQPAMSEGFIASQGLLQQPCTHTWIWAPTTEHAEQIKNLLEHTLPSGQLLP